ncbi:MAG TPA: DUF2589 domain-containing protein [Polyangiaceae bacterium]|nr:DUF2589 domain-containing protein [Polyangiaceae bacterium]
MLGQGKELAAIDFEDLIGGPLMAAIKAQAKAAITTTNFIQSFAFTQGSGGQQQLKVVSFDFGQVLDSTLIGQLSNMTVIKVPLLTIIPIPFIRIDSMTVDFNVNLHSTSKTTMSNDFTFSLSASGSYMGIGLAASVSDRNTYQNESTVDDTYSMHVNVHAVQDQMPGGMAQVLGIFSSIIQSQASLIQTIVTKQVEKLNDNANKALNPAPTPGP